MNQIYLITPAKIINLDDFTKKLKIILDNCAISLLQLRLKNTNQNDIIKIIDTILPILESYKIFLILNDDLNLAISSGCQGVHLGQTDLTANNIENLTKYQQHNNANNFIIGITCNNNIQLGIQAQKMKIHYVSFGALYSTTTKKVKLYTQIDIIHQWKKISKLPCAIIGGINLDNIKNILPYQPNYICISSGFWQDKDLHTTAKLFNKIVNFAK